MHCNSLYYYCTIILIAGVAWKEDRRPGIEQAYGMIIIIILIIMMIINMCMYIYIYIYIA